MDAIRAFVPSPAKLHCRQRPLARRFCLPLFLAFLLAATTAQGQLATIEFSYSNPGARSIGFGGAFVALADDATAAFANPAGLVQLTRPELSAEGRAWSYSTPYTAGGRLENEPSGIGVDTEFGLRIGESSTDRSGVSFLSFVYPKNDWRIALYRHKLADFGFSGQVNALFADAPAMEGVDPGFSGVVRDQDSLFSSEFDIVDYGIAAAYRVSEALSVGVSLSSSSGSFMLSNDEYLPDDDSIESYFATGSYRPERLQKRDQATLDDDAMKLSAGFLWRITQRWSAGGFYRQGPDFSLEFQTTPGPASPNIPAPSFFSPVSLPDVYGLGIAYRSADGRLTTSFEWDRVEYSSTISSLEPNVVNAEIKNGSEFHFGAEYLFIDSNPVIAARVGAWLDPDHSTRSVGDEPFARALFQPGDDEMHVAIGLGVAFRRFQIDLGLDFSELRDTASVSTILSF